MLKKGGCEEYVMTQKAEGEEVPRSVDIEFTEMQYRRDARVTIMFTAPMKLTLQQLAAALGWDLSDLVREAVRQYVNTNHQKWFREIYKHNTKKNGG